MRLLPFTKFHVEVNSDVETIKARLKPHVEKFWTNGKVWNKGAIFEGKLTEEGFVIRRNIRYRNSFLPILVGTFERKGAKTRIRITARMFILTNLFMVMWLGFTFFSSIDAAFSGEIMGVIPLLMFVFGWALMAGGFWFEFPRTIKEFKRVIE